MYKLNSRDTKAILKLTDRELMHLRTQEEIAFEKSGRSYLYSLPKQYALLDHPIGEQLLYWHSKKHAFTGSNKPVFTKSKIALEQLLYEILLPVSHSLGKPVITYGFTSFPLNSHIQKHSPSGTSPNLDQHSSHEKNSAGTQICSRGGAACDFFIEGVTSSDLTRYITANLNYDRIYFYGNDKPLHVSINLTDPLKYLQIMRESENGRRYPGKKAFGEQAVILAEDL